MREGLGLGHEVVVRLRRLLGVNLACLELRILVNGLRIMDFQCGDGWAKLVTSDTNALINAVNRAALVKEVIVNGVKHRPSLANTLTTALRTDAPHLNPLHALLMINLSGVVKGPLLDPFSGLGTISRIASELGIYAIGCDIRGASDFTCDATRLPIRLGSIEAIVTDPPFNRVFKAESRLSSLYVNFLNNAIDILTDRGTIVMMTPSYLLNQVIDEAQSLDLTPYCIGVDHVHGALSRFILCLSKGPPLVA